jgi:hypothetical protein
MDIEYLDLLQIDAEGYDVELLKLFDFERMRPPIVHYEHKKLSAKESDEAVELLAGHATAWCGRRTIRRRISRRNHRAPTVDAAAVQAGVTSAMLDAAPDFARRDFRSGTGPAPNVQTRHGGARPQPPPWSRPIRPRAGSSP